MELALVIYLIELFEKMSNFSGISAIFVLGVCFLVFTLFSMLGMAMAEVEDETVTKYFNKVYEFSIKPVKIFVIIALIGHGVAFFMPTKETSYTMLAAYGVQTVAQSEQVTSVLGKSSQVLEKYMDKYLEDSNEEVEKETSE